MFSRKGYSAPVEKMDITAVGIGLIISIVKCLGWKGDFSLVVRTSLISILYQVSVCLTPFDRFLLGTGLIFASRFWKVLLIPFLFPILWISPMPHFP